MLPAALLVLVGFSYLSVGREVTTDSGFDAQNVAA